MAERMTTKEAMEIVAKRMDDREEFKAMIRAFVEKHGYPPKQYEAEWSRMKDEKPWRQDAKCIDKLKKAARIMARNENERRRKAAKTTT